MFVASYTEGDDVYLSGSFTGPEAQGSYTVTVDWGDGTSDSPDVTATNTPGAYTFTIPAHDYAANGSYPATVTVADASGGTCWQYVTMNYTDVLPSGVTGLQFSPTTINQGDETTLSGSFTDPGADKVCTVTINWGDGTTEDPDTTILTLDPGATSFQSDPHTYSTPGPDDGAYTVTATVSDGQGSNPSTGKATADFTVLDAGISLTDFSTDGRLLRVAYTITNPVEECAAPFAINVYSSPDGTTPDQLLASATVADPSQLTAGAHAVWFAPPAQDVSGNYQLIALAEGQGPDQNPLDSPVEFDPGIFQGGDGTVYVFGGQGNASVDIQSGQIVATFDGNAAETYPLPSGVTGIDLRLQSGTNTVTAESGVIVPLSIYGGSGSDTITDAGSGADLLVAGDGGTANLPVTITHTGSGSATIDAGAGYTTIKGGCGSGGDTINFGTGTTKLYEGNGWNTPEIVDDSELTAGVSGRTDTYTDGSNWSTDATYGGFNQSERVHAAASNSTDKATWTFADLTANDYYDVYV
ncbi:MAG: hypothetical protein ABSG86_24375, partial [Thermoguttaceae bacterium]